MWNLIKAQNYQLKRDRAIKYMVCIIFGSQVLVFLDYLRTHSFSDLTGGYTAFYLGDINFIMLGMLVTLLSARIVGWDYTDKTINYELLAGHSRKSVYWCRVYVSLMWIIAGCTIFLFLPLLITGIINGWGYKVDMGNMLLRYVLTFFPLFRLFGECVLLTVLLKNCYMAMIIGWIMYEFSWVFIVMIEELIEYEFTVELCAINIYRLVYLSYSRLQYINGEDVLVYETVLEPGFIAGSIAVSLILGMAGLGIGYLYFKKSDIN